ncbi:unnamed protein product [Arabidopsis halleri]
MNDPTFGDLTFENMTFGDLISLRSRNPHFVIPTEEISVSYTCVFWNIDDYPIPDDINPDLIYSNIKSALEGMGYRCSDLEIFAYGEKIKEATELNELYDAGIKYSNHKVPDTEMLRDIVYCSINHKSSSNLMVISKSLTEDTESIRVLRALKSRGFNVLLVQPQSESHSSEQLFHYPDLLRCSTYLLDGQKAMDQTPSPDVFTSPSCSRSNFQDFSEPTTSVLGGPKTGVFWDVNECPFPNDLDPEAISKRIICNLKDLDVSTDISIWAYADKIPFSDDILDKFDKSRIYFVPQVPRDKTARVVRMVHDIDLWELDSPLADSDSPPNVIVISNDINTQGDISFYRCLRSMHARDYCAFLVQPKDIAQESLKTQEWPRWILAGIVSFSQMRYPVSNHKWKKKKKIKKDKAVEKPEVSSRVKTQDSPLVKAMIRQDEDLFYPIPPVSGPRIGVFWDVNDSPFPGDLDPNSIYQRIDLALEKKGYDGVMSIWAYYTEQEPIPGFLLDKYQSAGINIVPKAPANKTERVDRMIHDMLFWEMDTPLNVYVTPPSLIVISNDFPGEGEGDINLTFVLSCMNGRGYNVLLVEPKKLALDNPGSSALWPGCLLDVGQTLGLCSWPPSSGQKRRKKNHVEESP